MEEKLIDMFIDYLCEDHSERELRELTERAILIAIRLSNGEESVDICDRNKPG